MTAERWTTWEDLAAARARFEATLPGWRAPVAQGLALVRAEGDGGPSTEVPVVNTTEHRLPVVVLASVLGRIDGTATLEVTREQLDHAIELLTPAEAATFVQHPNLAAWREIRAVLAAEPTARAVAVFVEDLADPVSSPADAVLRSRLAQA